MNALDKFYMDLRDGVINQQTYEKSVEAYNKIPQVERERYDN